MDVRFEPQPRRIHRRVMHAKIQREAHKRDLRDAARLQIPLQSCWCFMIILEKCRIAVDRGVIPLSDDQISNIIL